MVDDIINFINKETGIDITKRKRTNEYVFARTVYYKLARELTNLSLEEIGSHVNKDHCSVIHNLRNFDEAIKRPMLKRVYTAYIENPLASNEASYSEVMQKNKDLVEEVRKLKENKYFIDEGSKEIDNMLQGLNQEQMELVKLRLEAMVKMIKTV